jgi:hypothetical protein
MKTLECSFAVAIAAFPHDMHTIGGQTQHAFACKRCQLAMRTSLLKYSAHQQFETTLRELNELDGTGESISEFKRKLRSRLEWTLRDLDDSVGSIETVAVHFEV